MEYHKHIFLIYQTAFLFGPLMFFYIKSYLDKHYRLSLAELLHFAPFILIEIYVTIRISQISDFVIWNSYPKTLTSIGKIIHTFIYIIFSVYYLYTRNSRFFPILNLKTERINEWIKIILLVFVMLWLVNLNSFALKMFIHKPGWCAYTCSIYSLISFIFINAGVLFALLKPEVFNGHNKYFSSNLSENDKCKIINKLSSYMSLQLPYLDPELTLESVSKGLSLNPRHLSQIINEAFNMNFKSYINEFRIKESIKWLSDYKNNKTVLEILYEVGFNSKSAFNYQFKQYTGLTPVEYKTRSQVRVYKE